MPLLWFHCFRRNATPDVIDVLRRGPEVAPVMTDTKQLELQLEIAPPAVYSYLGRTLEAFGDAAVAFEPADADGGSMSPFDTGGLVRKIAPVCKWSREDQRRFLADYSWPMRNRTPLLTTYPGPAVVDMLHYLDPARRPIVAGPHALWPGKLEASIWNDNEDWRCWTWEGRWSSGVDIGGRIVAWTCSPSRFAEMVAWAEKAAPADYDWFRALFPRYVPGGVGELVRRLRAMQVTS